MSAGAWSIYALRDPRVMSVRYVGVTSSTLGHRLANHISEARSGTAPKDLWILRLLASGNDPEIGLIEVVTESESKAIEREHHWIRHLVAQNVDLLNVSLPVATPRARAATMGNGRDLLRAFIQANHGGKFNRFASQYGIDSGDMSRIMSGERGSRMTVRTAAIIDDATGGAVPIRSWIECVGAPALTKAAS